jgi:hypothetical protein
VIKSPCFLPYRNLFIVANQHIVKYDEKYLKKVLVGKEKGSTFAPAFGTRGEK